MEASLAPEGPPISGHVSLTASNFPWEVHAYSHQPLPWNAPDGRYNGSLITLWQFCFQHDNEEGEWGCRQRTVHWIKMAFGGPWCTGAYSRALQASVYRWNWRVWNKTGMAGRGQLMGLSEQPTLLWVYCFSIIFCARVLVWPSEHTCGCIRVREGLLPHHSSWMDISQQWN